MKKRLGFVSNSSSSSFIIIAKKLSKVTKEDLKNKDIWVMGDMLYEGVDFFLLKDYRILNYINSSSKKFDFYDVKKIGEFEFELNKDDLDNGNYKVMSEFVDYHTSDSLEKFCENYNIDESIIKVLERREKLKKINNE